MYVGEQLSDLSDHKLTWVAQMGVGHLAVNTTRVFEIENPDGTWQPQGIEALRSHLARFGLTIDVLTLDLQSTHFSHHRFPGIMRALPSRDAEIAVIQQNVRAAGEVGIPCLKYNLNLLGVPRTGRTPGRGGAQYSHFDMKKWPDDRPTELGVVDAEMYWERITYFLERVVPVAEESKVRLACHPHDPAVPPGGGINGIDCVLGSVEGLARFLSIAESPYHGLNFCQGTVAEMCVEPKTEVLAAIRRFGGLGKIFMVHFRNIRGGYLDFEEVYPDEGDVDMLAAAREYKEVGYDGMLCPDHVPLSEADPDGERQHSFALGYTKALIQVVERENEPHSLTPSPAGRGGTSRYPLPPSPAGKGDRGG